MTYKAHSFHHGLHIGGMIKVIRINKWRIIHIGTAKLESPYTTRSDKYRVHGKSVLSRSHRHWSIHAPIPFICDSCKIKIVCQRKNDELNIEISRRKNLLVYCMQVNNQIKLYWSELSGSNSKKCKRCFFKWLF